MNLNRNCNTFRWKMKIIFRTSKRRPFLLGRTDQFWTYKRRSFYVACRLGYYVQTSNSSFSGAWLLKKKVAQGSISSRSLFDHFYDAICKPHLSKGILKEKFQLIPCHKNFASSIYLWKIESYACTYVSNFKKRVS